jgi:hypothetical protein
MTGEIRPYTNWGIGYGIAAAVLFVMIGLYGARRRMIRFTKRVSFGRTRHWVNFHIYAGFLFFLLVMMHTGFRLPTGLLTSWLWWLSLWLVVSGIIGVVVQRWIPGQLANGLQNEAHYDRIPELVNDLRSRAEELVRNTDRQLRRFYLKLVAPALKAPSFNVQYYLDVSGGIRAQTREFDYINRVLGGEDREKARELQNIYRTKLELDAHYTLQKALRWWAYLHIPVALAVVVLLGLHIFAVLYY